jgi:hypothetical protein
MRVDGYKSGRSGNERKGDQNKSEDFSHAHISSRAITIPLAGPRIYDRQFTTEISGDRARKRAFPRLAFMLILRI